MLWPSEVTQPLSFNDSRFFQQMSQTKPSSGLRTSIYSVVVGLDIFVYAYSSEVDQFIIDANEQAVCRSIFLL